jgi:hypothetical protein
VSNPWVVVGLTYDGDSVQLDDFSIYLNVIFGLDETPSVRGEDTVVPGRAGRTEGNRINDTLAVVLAGIVQADPTITDQDASRANFRTRLREIRSLFASNRARADLVATLEDGSVWTISARPMNIATTMLIPGAYWSGSIELEGYDDWDIAEAS